jgi:hypothetical protein
MTAFSPVPLSVASTEGHSPQIVALAAGRARVQHRLTACMVVLTMVAALGEAPAARAAAIVSTAIDRSVPPGEDFFPHANGLWIKATTIPADRGSWGPFVQLKKK